MFFTVLEIALLIMLPMVLFYQRSTWTLKQYLPAIIISYFVWYLTYALFHEFMHLLGVWVFDKAIYEIKLVPRFWAGELGSAHIEYDYQADSKDFIIIILPYARDLILSIVGYFLILKTSIKRPLTFGLVLIIMIFSPLFDIANNYFAYLTGYMNDFNALGESSRMWISHFIGISFILITGFIAIDILRKSKEFPNHKQCLSILKTYHTSKTVTNGRKKHIKF